MTEPEWHFPRASFAEKVYSLLANGPIQGVSVFAPRRSGKTRFLTRDLARVAEEKGHRVFYADLWLAGDSPLGILLFEFDRALRAGPFPQRMEALIGGFAPKFKVRTPNGRTEVDVDLWNLRGEAPEECLLLIDEYCERLSNESKPAFLLFDEIQELEKARKAEPIIAALRKSLDKRRGGLAAVFASSSRMMLGEMLSDQDAPFFQFAMPLDLPALGEDFVDHQLKAVHTIARARIAREKALKVFERLDRNPLIFRRWLIETVMRPDRHENEAIKSIQADLSKELGFFAKWTGLAPSQRIMAMALSSRVAKIYGKSGEEFIMNLTGQKPPSISTLQAAVGRLAKLGIVDKWDGEWRISDPVFEGWIRTRADCDF